MELNDLVRYLRRLRYLVTFLALGLIFSLPLTAMSSRDKPQTSPNDYVHLSPLRPAPARQISGLPRIQFPWAQDSDTAYCGLQIAEMAEPELPEPETGPRFAVIPAGVRPGEPITIAYADDFTGAGDYQAVLLNSRGTRLSRAPLFSFTRTPGGQELKAAILAVPSTVASGAFTVRIEAGGRLVQDIPLTVERRDFVSEVIALDEQNTEIRVAPNPQRDRESQILWAILSRTGTDFYDGGYFLLPVPSTRRTSFFGDRRVFEYTNGTSDTSIHAGVDFGVPMGTEVRACAVGRVVLAVFRIVTGNTVILEHLPGVYSLYYHMDSLSVEEGSIVEAGTVVGLSGSTGLSTGPHLHWEIRVAGENTDPDAFVARPVLDKDEILRNLIKYN
jgi:murein DD-endopeptidase MepM/ murein hydrolase activator NlpD